jgi:hypothetical protein
MTYQPNQYKAIALWHRTSYQYYIADVQNQAAKENAPLTAVFKNSSTGEWECVEDINNSAERKRITQRLAELAAKA